MRSATTASRNAQNYAHRNNHCCKTHGRNQTTPAAPAAHTRYLSSPAAATLHGKTQGFVLRLPPHNTRHATFMQPFQCDLQPQLKETHRTTHTGTTTVAKHIKRNQTTPAAPAAHTRYLSSPAAATLHGKTQGFVLRLPPHNTRHATFMQPFQCDLQPQLQETHRTTHTGTTIVAKQIEGTKRPQPHPPHTRGTFHRRLQPLFTRKNTRFRAPASSPTHHLPSSPLPFLTTSHRHHLASSPLPFLITSLLHHFPSSPLPFVTTPLPHHFPVSPLPFVTTSLLHHFPSPPLPFVTTPLHHHFPSSPLPFVTTSLLHHFPSSPLPFVTTPLHHHFLLHHFPSSPLPFLTTSLPHHFPS